VLATRPGRRALLAAGRVAGVLALIAAAVLPACRASAAAATSALECQGTVTVTYDPPLTATPKPTHVSGTEDFDYCPVGGVTGGEASGDYDTTAGCTSLRLLTVSTSTYRWDSGQTSEVTYTNTAIERIGDATVLVTEQGTVTAGYDQGKAAVYHMTLPQLDPLACMGTGVARLAGPEVLTFA
jgi:hypothetical protein